MRRAVHAAAAAVLLGGALLLTGCDGSAHTSGAGVPPGDSAQLSSAEAALDRLEHDIDTDGGG